MEMIKRGVRVPHRCFIFAMRSASMIANIEFDEYNLMKNDLIRHTLDPLTLMLNLVALE